MVRLRVGRRRLGEPSPPCALCPLADRVPDVSIFVCVLGMDMRAAQESVEEPVSASLASRVMPSSTWTTRYWWRSSRALMAHGPHRGFCS
jgi:hypothetical protein